MKNRILSILSVIILASTNLAGQWVVKHVDVQGPTIYDLEMLPDGMGIAVGNSGLILRSDDYGENWATIPCNVDVNFYQIALISKDTFVARGVNEKWDGALYLSVDGGYTWEKVYTHKTELFSLLFFNDSVGLASGANAIIRTTDGGSTWSAVYDIPVFTNYKAGVIWVDVADDSVAYACVLAWNDGLTNLTRYLLKSMDAGLTWEESVVLGAGFGYCELYFFNEWYGFYDWDYPKRTIDGGVTWDSTNNIGFVVDISMPSMNKIYTVNHPVAYIPEPDLITEFAICTSEDGGLTWQGQMAPGAHLETILFINDSVGFVAGDHSLILKTEHCGGEIIGDYPWELYTEISQPMDKTGFFRIHPNPASDAVHIRWDVPDVVIYSLYDMQGRILYQASAMPGGETLSLATGTFPSGMYVVRAVSERGETNQTTLILER
jgi:photosystem II stability/assembly factor-like uncharacterized protein